METPQTSEPLLYDYTQVQSYLRDWIAWAKQHRRGISLSTISAKVGIRSKSQLHAILHAELPPMGAALVGRFSDFLGHDARQREYFTALVAFSRSTTTAQKTANYGVMHRLQPRRRGPNIAEIHYEYLTDPLLPLLREAVCLPAFDGNFKRLGRRLSPPLSEAKVRAAVDRLLLMGILEEQPEGRFRQVEPLLDTGHDLVSLAVTRYHQDMAHRAAEMIAHQDPALRQMGGLTFSYPREKLDKLKRKLQAFQDELIQDILAESAPANQVYQINLHLFPLLDAVGENPSF